jgi:hypothetical protein
MDCILCGVGSWCCCVGYIIRKGIKEEREQCEIQKTRDIEKIENDYNNFVNGMKDINSSKITSYRLSSNKIECI